jgi:hypothetical protein
VSEKYPGLPIFPDPKLDALVEAIAEAAESGELPAHQAGVMVELIERYDHLRERGYLPGPRGVAAPAERPPELDAEAKRIAARWHELSAQVRAGNPPRCEWIGLSEAERQLINELHRYPPCSEREAEAC